MNPTAYLAPEEVKILLEVRILLYLASVLLPKARPIFAMSPLIARKVAICVFLTEFTEIRLQASTTSILDSPRGSKDEDDKEFRVCKRQYLGSMFCFV